MSETAILVHPRFDASWPFAADHLRAIWEQQHGPVTFERLAPEDTRAVGEVLPNAESVTRLVALGPPVTLACAANLSSLREVAVTGDFAQDAQGSLKARGVRIRRHESEGFWGQSVAEFALALTLCGLRRIPQTHHQIITDLSPWNYTPKSGVGKPGERGQQYGDDSRFTAGTLAGKRVRVVGAGNIASRYASFCALIGADVSAYDPFASEPAFHRSGAKRERHLGRLASDAQIFAPLVPLHDGTRGMVTAELIHALPQGCLLVLATRAKVCDMNAVRARVLSDEISLTADVWDVEPLPLSDPLLGRHNVVHTPHNAGRTKDANRAWAEALAEQFDPAEGDGG